MSEKIFCKTISLVFLSYEIDLVLLMNAYIFLVLQSALGRRLGKDFIGLKHVVCSLVDLFNSRQLYISCTKYVKLFFKIFDQGKRLSLFAWWQRGEGL